VTHAFGALRPEHRVVAAPEADAAGRARDEIAGALPGPDEVAVVLENIC